MRISSERTLKKRYFRIWIRHKTTLEINGQLLCLSSQRAISNGQNYLL